MTWEERKRRYLQHFATLPPEQQDEHIKIWLAYIQDALDRIAVLKSGAVEVNPEEVPHPDQDAIDSAFAAIMADVDL